ncbi:MAG: YggU family protein [Deltaproteobacteria bacterium RIFCSPLOWO2_02_FULL_47_10]|nr:MAG: YggU family protein [Deltaproteobacteria bacterium RIFCSPLOWO2_02_FULL_47_10]
MIIKIYIQPGASKNEIVGKHGDAIKIRLTAPPIEGRANEALVDFLAKEYKVPKSKIEIIKGHFSRQKLVKI